MGTRTAIGSTKL